MAPSEYTSDAVVDGSARACSGEVKAMVPSVSEVRVMSLACEMPKSMRRGPSSGSRMFWGLTSRWTMPASCSSTRAFAVPAAIQRTAEPGSRPALRTSSDSAGAGMYSMAIQGRSASGSESRTRAV